MKDDILKKHFKCDELNIPVALEVQRNIEHCIVVSQEESEVWDQSI